jgi:hypothetical protein
MYFFRTSLLTAGALSGVDGANIYAHTRADKWVSNLPEHGTDKQKNGRRTHIVIDGVSIAESDIASVKVRGQDGLSLSDDLTYFDWFRAHSNPATNQVWLSFHSRNEDWLDASSIDVQITGKDGTTVVDDTVAAGPPGLDLTYVTTRNGGAQVVLHIHSNGKEGDLSKVVFDGVEVPLPSWAARVPANGHVVLTVDGVTKKPGDIWTAVLFTGSDGIGYGGRVVPERFPIEAWPKSDDCPLPGGNEQHMEWVKSLGIDSIYYSASQFNKKCDADWTTVVNSLATVEDGWFHVMAGPGDVEGLSPAVRATSVDAVLIGDEVDGDIDADHLRPKLKKALEQMAAFPDVPTYMGSKTNHNVGSFAGITDIQGSDAYCAACAPTMLEAVRTLPLRYPYSYLRNARDNHAPLPFWGYSQLYSDAWSYQANPAELVSQLGQVILSGSKAVMFFQANYDKGHAKKNGPLESAIQSIRNVADIVREGDIQGVPFSVSSELNKEVMAETILSPEKLLVVVINTNADGYSNLLCHTLVDGRHWKFNATTVETMTLDLDSSPGIGSVSNWQESTKDGLVPLSSVDVSGSSGSVTLSNIAFDDKNVVRLFVADLTPPIAARVVV